MCCVNNTSKLRPSQWLLITEKCAWATIICTHSWSHGGGSGGSLLKISATQLLIGFIEFTYLFIYSIVVESSLWISNFKDQVVLETHSPSLMFIAHGIFSFSASVTSSLSVLNYKGYQTIEFWIIKVLLHLL